MASEESKDLIISLLNGANSSERDKQDYLASAYELIFHKEPILLDEFYASFVDFALDRSKAVKIQIIPYIESICKKYPKYFSISNLNLLLTSDIKSVVKRTILCITNLIRAVLFYIVQSPQSDQIYQVWNSFNIVKDHIVKLSISSEDESIRTSAFKMLEVLILSYSSPSEYKQSKKYKSDEEFSLDKVPSNHYLISKSSLNKECETYLNILLDSAKDLKNMTSQNIMTLVTSLTNILRQRFSMLPKIITVICQCPNIVPRFQTVQQESVRHTLKVSLLSIIRLKKKDLLAPYMQDLIQACNKIDSKDAAEEAARWFFSDNDSDKKKRHFESSHDSSNKKKSKTEHVYGVNNNVIDYQQSGNNSNDNNNSNNNNNNSSNNINNINNGNFVEKPGLLMDSDTLSKIIDTIEFLNPDFVRELVIENMSHVPIFGLLQGIPQSCPGFKEITEFLNSYQNKNIQPVQFVNNFQQRQPFPNQPYMGGYKSPALQPQPQQGAPNQPFILSPPVPPSQSTFHKQQQQKIQQNQPPKIPPQFNLQQTQPNTLPLQPVYDNESDDEVDDETPLFKEEIKNVDDDDESESEEKEMVKKEENTADQINESNTIDSIGKAEIIPSVTPRPVFKIPPLTPERAKHIGDSALMRIKICEPGIITTGKHHLWTSILGRILSLRPDQENIEELDEFVPFIVEDFQNHREFALQWLYNELFIAKQILPTFSPDSMKRYTNLLRKLIKYMRKHFPPKDPEIGLFILDVPYITDQLLHSINCKVVAEAQGLIYTSSKWDLNKVFSNEHNVITKPKPPTAEAEENGTTASENGNVSDSPDQTPIDQKTLQEKESEWLPAGLAILRDLILWRPTVRTQCLNSLLEFSTSKDDTVRAPSINLIANQLYIRPSLQETIHNFAKEQILLLNKYKDRLDEEMKTQKTKDPSIKFSELMNQDDSDSETELKIKIEKDDTIKIKEEDDEVMKEDQQEPEQNQDLDQEKEKEEKVIKESPSATNDTGEKIYPEPIQKEIKKFIETRVTLFFSLIIKNHQLLSDLLELYPSYNSITQDVVKRLAGFVIKHIGQSGITSSLLQVISVCPVGSENLTIEVLNSLVASEKPSQELVDSVKSLLLTNNDLRFLLPVVKGLKKEEIISRLPSFISLPNKEDSKQFILVLASGDSPISASELLVQLHLISNESLLKNVIDSIDYCLSITDTFKQEIVAASINQLMAQSQLPKFFMRTILKTLQIHPRLKTFVVEILSRLVAKQVWNDKTLWDGFIYCAKLAKPESLEVVLQLPPPQFEMACSNSDLKNIIIKFLKDNDPKNYPKQNIKILNIK
ncbi:hypothetical protein DICPUDRAFT_89712 [Dictyostelium purpureum]|uniref:Symplekin n=1 Tax=Dictyostelium purpureum TaxID=5786 RepID=F0ZXP5_DICPU|nr:uncharacterized protein DICPUDRAFT_89712 [Dictyostelium purpureum]EGC31283.1 hypothetical protein DICPUDRAFT_89712 [Dictyostelium purpureum]|eukprot:XP_003292192.1 hypothetical protein DICPUDRAFT_89712 [Dictyostelium purpureum]